MVTETNKFSYLLSSHPIANTFFKHFNYPCCSVTQSHSTLCDPWTSAHQASLSFTVYQSLLNLTFIESVMPSNHLILCRPPSPLPSIFPSIRVFSKELDFPIRWPKYWSVSFSISLSSGYSGLLPFRIDCFDLPAVQRTCKDLL